MRSDEYGITFTGQVNLAGPLTAHTTIWSGSGGIIGNGNMLILNYTDKESTCKAMCPACISEDTIIQINLLKDQIIGSYAILCEADSLFHRIAIDVENNVVGLIDSQNQSIIYGNYIYTIHHDVETQNILLTIDISPDSDSSYNVVYWDKEGNFFHADALCDVIIGSDQFHTVIVRNQGVLSNCTLTASGLLTVYSGGQVTGLKQEEKGKLRFDYAEGDTTTITGTNVLGEFSVSNNSLYNVVGENVKSDVWLAYV